MDDRGGSFVAVRRISQGLDRSNTCHSSSAEFVTGSTAWLGRGLSCVCAQRRESDARPSFDLTPAQEECLQRLQSRIDIPYDGSIPEHQDTLRALWSAAFPEEKLHGLISEQWKDMGWQGKDPSTDFRGGGFISLENLLFFARNFPKSFQDLLRKQEGDRSVWEYPFAVAGVNITSMLIQMLDLEAGDSDGTNFMTHIISVNSGEDITMKVISFSQQGPRAICILSASGVISNVTLRQPDSSGGTLTYEGQFEILSLSGSFMPTDNQGTRSRSGGMSVSLSSPDGRVVGGGVAGLLVESGPVQVVVGIFLPNNRQEQKPKKPKSDYAPANVTASIAVSSAPPPTNGEKEDVMGGHLLHNTQEQPLTQTLLLPRPFVAKTGLTCTPFQTRCSRLLTLTYLFLIVKLMINLQSH